MLDHCIGRFDHYCPWVVNAVGYKNHQWFLGYLFMVLVIVLLHTLGAMEYLDYHCNATEILRNPNLASGPQPYVLRKEEIFERRI